MLLLIINSVKPPGICCQKTGIVWNLLFLKVLKLHVSTAVC